MILFPNCKINLGLRILRKRTDGYHELETVFYPLDFTDALETVRTEQRMEFTSSGLSIDGSQSQNLCMKAYDLLRQSCDLPPLLLHLHKRIPAGAGLGGGSGNAAFTLRLLNSKFNLGLTRERLLDLALQLGSDCPFFLINEPCLATGRGEIMEKLELPEIRKYFIVLVNAGIHVQTSWAFSRISPGRQSESIRKLITKPVADWKENLQNDFEEVVFAKHPALRDIKNSLYQQGAIYSAMSGSGSTIYGFFRERPDLNFGDVFVKIIEPRMDE